jgi:exodeoxyribonuclease-5
LLADQRDTLALGALLRGPLVGLTEEELLDIVRDLPRSDDEPDRIPRLGLGVDVSTVSHPLAREVIARLQSLRKRVNSTTPHDLLSQAVDVMRVRPILLARHGRQAERALANVDLYLSLSAGYAVRGLRAFSEAMTAAWEDEEKAVEGRPDAQEEAVVLFTMHAAKGLEWPVVIPVNTMTGVVPADTAIMDRETGTFYCPVLGVAPRGYEDARQSEKDELDRERIRLWYVAATRARELLLLPRLDVAPQKGAWIGLVDLLPPDLPAFDAAKLPAGAVEPAAAVTNGQTRETFAQEAAGIVELQTHLTWLAPSRDENGGGPVMRVEEAAVWASDGEAPPVLDAPAPVQGGRERGLILHKLMEEVLTGELDEALERLSARAAELVRAFGRTPAADAAVGLSPHELGECVTRTLAIAEIAALRADLLPEFSVYALREDDAGLVATAGVADALTTDGDGRPVVVVDWKSDVAPDPATVEHYRAQVRAYLAMTGAERGLIVMMTSGRVIEVGPAPVKMAA